MLSTKRAVSQFSHGRWNPIHPKHSFTVEQARALRSSTSIDGEGIDFPGNERDFILSVLRAKPSFRDTKSYLALFSRKKPVEPPERTVFNTHDSSPPVKAVEQETTQNPLIDELLNPVQRRTALVKLQGPFTERQLESIARGMVYLEKLGLVSVIVVERDDWFPGKSNERDETVEETMRVVSALEAQNARARPVLDTIVRLGPRTEGDEGEEEGHSGWIPEAHALPSDLVQIRSALKAGEIPVIPALALDSFCRSVRIAANDVIGALTRAMVEVGQSSSGEDMNMTPMRLMIINREGGIPSYARNGLPHLLVNINSEYDQIQQTFLPQWTSTHPTALSNLALAKTCLSYMPRSSSAIMVSHRSSSSLIANLITNKPAQSSSLPYALLTGNKKLTQHTPTLFRHGLPIRVIQSPDGIDKNKLTNLLEQSFGRKLDANAFYNRVDTLLKFVIIAGDYVGAAVVTTQPTTGDESFDYLDKFAVLPSHQGDGTVDFLWVALYDESYGLGSPHARNFNAGGMQGVGTARDVVWRSRANNPVNNWYFERSSGHCRMGDWVLFWCDAEHRLKTWEDHIRSSQSPSVPRNKMQAPSFIADEEKGRIDMWANAVSQIPSSWQKAGI